MMKVNKKIKLLALSSVIPVVLAIAVSAQDEAVYYYKMTATNKTPKWTTTSLWTPNSDRPAGNDTPTLADLGVAVPPSGSHITLTPNGNNNAVFYYDINPAVYQNYTLASFYLHAGVNTVLELQYDMTVTGDYTYNSNTTTVNRANAPVRTSADGASSLFIGGNVYNTALISSAIMKFGGDSLSLSRLVVNKNMEVGLSNLWLNAKNGIAVKGIVDMKTYSEAASGHTTTTGVVYLNTATNSSRTQSLRFGALQSELTTTMGSLAVNSVAATSNVAQLTFTGVGSGSYTFNGNVVDIDNASATGTGGIHIIMDASNSDFTQIFAGSSIYKGNTILTNGKLQFNASKTDIGAIYLGYDTKDIRDDATDVVDMAKLDTSDARMAAANTTLIFDGAGAKATELNWSAGSILMSLNDAAKNSAVLTLSGAINLVGDGIFKFLFNDNLIEGETYKLISGVTAFNGDVSKLTSDYGNQFSFADGTLSFTAGAYIPEPGTYAAIFGALALAFAAYRRRK